MAMMLMGSVIFAQKSAGPERAEKMKTELSLSETQYTRIKDINEKFKSDQAELLTDTAMSRENVRLERKRMQDERISQIKSVLTEAQFSQWTEMNKNERKLSQTKGRTGARAGNPMEEMKTALDLNDSQVKKVREINVSMAARFKALRQDTAVSRGNMRAEMQKVMEERKAAFKKVLTDDQYSRFLEYEAGKASQRRPGGRPVRH